MEDDSGVAPVRVTFEQLKAAARKLERLDGNSRKDLEERRTPAGRGRQSAVQAELRAMSATKNSRVLSSCSALSRAVQDAVTASTTSSRKELSIEEQRELNARRKMAAKGELALHERTTSSLDEDRRRNQQAKASSGGTHGVLGRTGSVDAAAGLSHARSPPAVDSSRIGKQSASGSTPVSTPAGTPLRRPLGRGASPGDGRAAIWGQAFSQALRDHQPEPGSDDEEMPSTPVQTALRPATTHSLDRAQKGSSSGGVSTQSDVRGRLGTAQAGGHVSSAGILASPPALPVGRGRAKQRRTVLTTTVSPAHSTTTGWLSADPSDSAPTVDLTQTSSNDAEDVSMDDTAADTAAADLRITIQQKRRRDPSISSPDRGGATTASAASDSQSPKRKRISSAVFRK